LDTAVKQFLKSDFVIQVWDFFWALHNTVNDKVKFYAHQEDPLKGDFIAGSVATIGGVCWMVV